jgi:hypothetical protein
MKRIVAVLCFMLVLGACSMAHTKGKPGTITFTDDSTVHCAALNVDDNTVNCFDEDTLEHGGKANGYPTSQVKFVRYES